MRGAITVLESERMTEQWRRSVLVLIFKKNVNVQNCTDYRGIKLKSYTMGRYGKKMLKLG